MSRGFIHITILSVTLSLLAGCGMPRVVSTTDAGLFVNATMQEHCWNEPIICRIETTKGVFLVPQCTVSGIKGEPCTVVTYADGEKYLRIGDGRGFLIERN